MTLSSTGLSGHKAPFQCSLPGWLFLEHDTVLANARSIINESKTPFTADSVEFLIKKIRHTPP